jgi:lysophospholipase L1-like esterase
MVILCLAGSEGIFRLTQKPRDYELWRRRSLRYDYDPHAHWRIRPGEYIHKKTNNIECINSIGLRCPELDKKKASGTIRIIALGGSSTYIVSPESGESWTDLLETKLQERTGLRFEVVNAGTPGYSSYQSVMRMKYELIDYNPDLVIIYNLSNDMKLFSMTDPESMIEKWDAHGKANAAMSILNPNWFLDFLCRYSQMVTHGRFKLIKARTRKVMAGHEGWKYDSFDLKVTDEGIEFYKNNHRMLIDTLKPSGIPLVIVKQATLVGPDNTPRDIEEIRYDYFGFNHQEMLRAYKLAWEALEELCAQDNVYCVRGSTDIPHNVDYFNDEVHLTDLGRETLAEIIARDMTEFFGDFQMLLKTSVTGNTSTP